MSYTKSFIIIFFFIFMVVLIITIMFFLIFFLSEKEKSMEYKQMFESGIEMNKFSRIIFSIQFFMIAFIFILFDLEIIILLTLLFYLNNYLFFIYLLLFIFFMLISLVYEWKYNKLLWFK